MYEYIPQKTNQKATRAVGVSMIGGGAVLILTTAWQSMPFRWAVQLVGIAFWGLVIFLYTRYVAKGYVYRVIQAEDGTLDFLVDEYQRKKRTTVCRIGVSGITEAVAVKAAQKDAYAALKRRIKEEHRHGFDYTADLAPDEWVCLLCEEGGEPLAIRIQPDETLLRILRGE